MPNHQKHRGQHSRDYQLFADNQLPKLCAAIQDLSYLQERGYPQASALNLVGNRYQLSKRQRQAVLRAACGSSAQFERNRLHFSADLLGEEVVFIDTYNLLITVESALSNGLLLHCLDSCYRDLASIHSTYRKVEETIPAIKLIGKSLISLKVKKVKWFLDQPISNSGRLKQLILSIASEHDWQWEGELVYNPDKVLVNQTEAVVISSDSWVIEHSWAWFNLVEWLIDHQKLPSANVLKFY